MFEDAAEVVKIVGSIGGFASAAFLVWDRIIRCQPIFALHIVSGTVQGNNHAYLRLKNVMDEDVIIDGIVSEPPYLVPALDHELDSIAIASIGKMGLIILAPREDRILPLVILNRADGDETVPVKITASWRRTRRRWPWPLTATIRTSVQAVRELERARLGQKPLSITTL